MVVAQGELGFLGSRLDIYARGMSGIQSPGYGVDDDDRDQGRGRVRGSRSIPVDQIETQWSLGGT